MKLSPLFALCIAGCSINESPTTDPLPDPQNADDSLGVAISSSSVLGPAGWRMPWATGSSYRLTGGPHNGSSLTPCGQVTLDGSSGLDFGMSNGTEVLSIEDGTLVDWGDNMASAPELKWVIIAHGNGWSTRYWHLSSNTNLQTLVKGKSFVSQGRIVGQSGTPSGGAHLHLELRYDGAPNTWHGQAIDGYHARGMPLQANSATQLNYQGTLTRGTETTANVNYAGCSNTAVVKTSGSGGTVEAGSSSTVGSTNTRRTVNEANFIADQGTSFTKGGTLTWSSAAIGYNNQMWFTSSNGSVRNNFARWTLPASMGAGDYKLYAYIPNNNATTLHAKYQIVHNGVSQFAPDLNQQRNSNVWVRIGPGVTYHFSGSGSEYVELSDATGEAAGATRVGVDALIFVNTVPSTTPPPTCGAPCTQCVLNLRTDILPFYQMNGWDISCGNRNAILTNWCGIDPAGCASAKSSPTCQASCIAGGTCGNACTACVLQQRTDILPFYQMNGWDISCGNRNAIVANWCGIDPGGCAAVKTGGACRASCGF